MWKAIMKKEEAKFMDEISAIGFVKKKREEQEELRVKEKKRVYRAEKEAEEAARIAETTALENADEVDGAHLRLDADDYSKGDDFVPDDGFFSEDQETD